MFSDPESGTIYLRASWAQILTRGSALSSPTHIHSLAWRLFVVKSQTFLHCKVGFVQPADATVCCAAEVRLVIDSVDGSTPVWLQHGARLNAICRDERSVNYYGGFPLSDVEQCLDNDMLSIMVFLIVYKPVKFRSVCEMSSFCFDAPGCLHIVGQSGSTVFMVFKTAQISNQIEEWSIRCVKIFLPTYGRQLAKVQVNRWAFVGSEMTEDQQLISLSQVDTDENVVQLDLVDTENGALRTMRHAIPATDQDLDWSKARMSSLGWICVASGLRGAAPPNACFRFWRVGDELELLCEMVQPTAAVRNEELATVRGDHVYCMYITLDRRYMIYVCQLSAVPRIWQPYEICPFPAFFPNCLGFGLGHLILYTQAMPGPQDVLFRLEFGTTECFMVPFVVAPDSLTPASFWMGDRTLFSLNDDGCVSVLDIGTLRLNVFATVTVRRLLSNDDDWRLKLLALIGPTALLYL